MTQCDINLQNNSVSSLLDEYNVLFYFSYGFIIAASLYISTLHTFIMDIIKKM